MKRLSISRNLTVSILLTVMVVSGIGIFASYYIATQKTSADLNEKADEYLAFIVNTVGEPLWYLNDRHLKEIVSYFDKNEHIAGLNITDSSGKKIFSIAGEDIVPVITSDGIIKSLADLTRTTALNLERLNLIDVVVGSIKTAGPPETVKVIETYAEEEIEIDGDPEALGMAFRNIIHNAIRSMDGKGSLSVALKRTDEHEVEVSFADTGPGISQEHLSKIFQPLFTTRAKGMGFGLSMTKMIVEKHHGAIHVKSEQGNGATFTVRLPIHMN